MIGRRDDVLPCASLASFAGATVRCRAPITIALCLSQLCHRLFLELQKPGTREHDRCNLSVDACCNDRSTDNAGRHPTCFGELCCKCVVGVAGAVRAGAGQQYAGVCADSCLHTARGNYVRSISASAHIGGNQLSRGDAEVAETRSTATADCGEQHGECWGILFIRNATEITQRPDILSHYPGCAGRERRRRTPNITAAPSASNTNVDGSGTVVMLTL